jgi:glycosyltransferase involved in cell wall biosynthesis
VIIDNGSIDQTSEKIKSWISRQEDYFQVRFFQYPDIQSYCKLFNDFLKLATGKYLVDLSGDDLLYPEHLSASILELSKVPSAALVFSDAYLLDEKSRIRTFYRRRPSGELKDEFELSNCYETLVKKNLICSPTMVFNTEILRNEGGYDEELYYEDFDVQLRLARNYPIVFSNHIGVLKRIHSQSMSSKQYQKYRSKMLPSTVKVCAKILKMNRTIEENNALAERIQYELKHALWSANFESSQDLVNLGDELGIRNIGFFCYKIWAKKKWDISWLYTKLT